MHKQKPIRATVNVCKVIGTPLGKGIESCAEMAISDTEISNAKVEEKSKLRFLVNALYIKSPPKKSI